jgi:hypothetical protein
MGALWVRACGDPEEKKCIFEIATRIPFISVEVIEDYGGGAVCPHARMRVNNND